MPFGEKLNPTQRLVLGAFTVATLAVGFAGGRLLFGAGTSVAQPIQFNHQKHARGAGIDCSTCHQYYAEHQHSGLPDLSVCMTCHQQPVTKSPEEARLISLAATPSPPAFRKLFRLPDHVYYSHRRHVTVARLPCETCHGAIADSTAPPSRPLVRVTMATCTGCHTRMSVRRDCTDCHR